MSREMIVKPRVSVGKPDKDGRSHVHVNYTCIATLPWRHARKLADQIRRAFSKSQPNKWFAEAWAKRVLGLPLGECERLGTEKVELSN